MVNVLPRRLGRAIWPIMVSALVSLAIYVSGGKLIIGALPQFKADIEQVLSQQLPGRVSFATISGNMDGFSPRLSITQFALQDETNQEWVRFPEVSLRIDPWESLTSGALRFDELTLIAPRIEWSDQGASETPPLSVSAQGLFNSFARLRIRDAEFLLPSLVSNSSEGATTLSIDMDLVRDRSLRTIAITVQLDDKPVFSAAGSGTGNPFEIRSFSGEVYGHLSGEGASLASKWLGQDVVVEGSSDFWFSVLNGTPHLVLQAQMTGLSLGSQRRVKFEQLKFDLAAMGPPETMEVWLGQGSLSADAGVFQIPRMHIRRRGAAWELLTEAWDVASASSILSASGLLSDKASEVLAALAPTGDVESLMLSVASLATPMSSWQGAAVVADATTQPFRKVPGLSGIDASIAATAAGAKAWIATRDFSLSLPQVYESPIYLETVFGELAGRWQRGALFLEEGLFLTSAPDHDGLVQFEIDIPLSKPAMIPLEMRLAASVDNAPASVRNAYIPYRLPEPTYRWLQRAVPQGMVERATFLWHGGFGPYGHLGQTLQLGAMLTDLELAYQPGWPNGRFKDARVRMSDQDISVVASYGRVAESNVYDVNVQIEVGADDTGFALTAHSDGSPAALLKTLKQLPALSVADAVMHDLTVAGDQLAQTRMELAFDLRDISQTLNLGVDVDLSGASVASALLDLRADNVSGVLRYRTSTGFESDELRATVFGRPVEVMMGPELATRPGTLLAARIDGEVSISDLLSWQDMTMPIPADGTASVAVHVNVAEDTSVDIHSDLLGVAVDLPLPWGKPAQAKAPLQVAWRNRDWAAWEVFWFGRLTAVADVPALGDLSTIVDLTPRTRPPKSASIAPAPGLTLTGFIPSLDLIEWRSLDQISTGGQSTNEIATRIANLKIGRLLWDGEELGQLSLNLQRAGEVLAVQFDLPWLSGEFAQRRAAPVTESDAGFATGLTREFELSFIDLDGLPTFGEQLADSGPPNPNEGLGQWMRGLPVLVHKIRRGDVDLGDLRLVIDYVDAEGWQFRDISGDFLGIEWLPATQIAWRDRGAESTTLKLSAQLNDIAASLDLIGVAPILETRGGKVDATWQWPGGPMDFALPTVSGNLNLEMRTGSFLTANAEATGAMRLLSLLNLSGLFRRANMNQLFDPGVTFDRAEGNFEFEAGLMHIPGFSIEGSGGYFNFTSDIDLLEETLDGELVVTLPLVENIPWVAALAGGLPVAAGTYLVSKVFEDQVNQLSSGVYAVSGNLNDPVVVFERVFDAKVRDVRDDTQETSSPVRSRSAR